MTSILKVDQLQDSAGNAIITSDGAGNLTAGTIPAKTIGTGAVLQVVSTVKTDTFSSTANLNARVTITGLTATITPSSTSSKILILTSLVIGASGNNHSGYELVRDSTPIFIGDAATSRPRLTTAATVQSSGVTWETETSSSVALDSPNTTSATTYSIKIGGNGSATIYINRSGRDNTGSSGDGRYVSTITLMEIAG